jgi:hypothetical protein
MEHSLCCIDEAAAHLHRHVRRAAAASARIRWIPVSTPRRLRAQFIQAMLPIVFPIVVIIYYVLWKYVVASLNEISGIR